MKPPSFWYSDERGFAAVLLQPLSWLMTGVARWRRRRVQPQQVEIPVICIGNVTLGGAGKTPLALALGKHFLQQGRAVHFLTRGYGGRARGPLRIDPQHHDAALVGDEALELADVAPCWLSRDRLAGARAAASDGAELLILDDGLQNPYLRYDLSVLVVDGARGLGNGCVLPAGPLREPWADASARADLVVVMKGESRQPLLLEALKAVEAGMLFSARLHPRAMSLPKRLLAFSGIAYPEKFLASLKSLGGDVVASVAFPDHHCFSEKDASMLLQRASHLDATLITTYKDAMRLKHKKEDGSACGRLAAATSVLRVDARIDDITRFDLCMQTLLAARSRRSPR